MLQRKISDINGINKHIRNKPIRPGIIRAYSLLNTPVTKTDGITQRILLPTRIIPQSHVTPLKWRLKRGNIYIIASHTKLLSTAENKDNNHAYSKTGKDQQYVTYVPRSIITHQKKLGTKQDGNQANNENHKTHHSTSPSTA